MDNATCNTCSQMFHCKWVDLGLDFQKNRCDECSDREDLRWKNKMAEHVRLTDLSKQYEKAKRLYPTLEFYDWYKKILYPHPLEKIEADLEYAFTFTSSPSLGLSADHFVSACELLCKIGMTAKYERIVRCAYVIEYHESGHPHLHGVYSTGTPRRITTKSFQRAWKQWKPYKNQKSDSGFPGGYHSLVKHGQSYADYISKGDGLGNQGKVFNYTIAKTTAPPEIILT